jgi:hypothetical protein
MYGLAKSLSADIHVDDYTLRFVCETSITICHGESNHFVGTSDDSWELAIFLVLALHYCFND